jgi:hypothetical protein
MMFNRMSIVAKAAKPLDNHQGLGREKQVPIGIAVKVGIWTVTNWWFILPVGHNGEWSDPASDEHETRLASNCLACATDAHPVTEMLPSPDPL